MKKRGLLLKLVRVFVRQSQATASMNFGVDQSTISRIEKGELYITPEIEARFVEACGGVTVLQTLLDGIQGLLDRINHNRLTPA